MVTLVAGVVGLAVGFFVAWLCFKVALVRREAVLTQELNTERAFREQERLSTERTAAEVAERARRDEAHLRELMAATVDGALEKFATASHDQLKENGLEFAAFNRKNISELLDPLKVQLKEYDESLKRVQERSALQEAAMKEHVEALESSAKKLGTDAGTFLANLTCSNKYQGDFGENRLAYVLEQIGLTAGEDFDLQTGENKKIPDCQVYDHIGRKVCVIDSKMSWKDYESAFTSPDPEERTKGLEAHAKSVRKQIDNLSGRKYHEVLTPNREGYSYLPFSVMFVPSDGALMVALEQDPSLPVYAASRNVFLTSPLNLFGFLKLIEKGRPCYEFARNVEKMVAEAKLVVERVDDVFGSLEDAMSHVDKARLSIETAMDRAAKDGSGHSIKGPAERMVKMGVRHVKLGSKTLSGEHVYGHASA